jgi:hypothetical protein
MNSSNIQYYTYYPSQMAVPQAGVGTQSRQAGHKGCCCPAWPSGPVGQGHAHNHITGARTSCSLVHLAGASRASCLSPQALSIELHYCSSAPAGVKKPAAVQNVCSATTLCQVHTCKQLMSCLPAVLNNSPYSDTDSAHKRLHGSTAAAHHDTSLSAHSSSAVSAVAPGP